LIVRGQLSLGEGLPFIGVIVSRASHIGTAYRRIQMCSPHVC
jgi:hypothetical protein